MHTWKMAVRSEARVLKFSSEHNWIWY